MLKFLLPLLLIGSPVFAATDINEVSNSATSIVQPKSGAVFTVSRTGQPPETSKVVNADSNPVPIKLVDWTLTITMQPVSGATWTVSKTAQPNDTVNATPVAGAVFTTSKTAQPNDTVNATPVAGVIWTVSLTAQPADLNRSIGFTTTVNATSLTIDSGGTSVFVDTYHAALLRPAGTVSSTVPVYASVTSLNDAKANGASAVSVSHVSGPLVLSNHSIAAAGFYLYLYAPTPTDVCLVIER